MRPLARVVLPLLLLAAACGPGSAPARPAPGVRQVLTNAAEYLEFESVATRADLLRDIVRQSAAEAGQPAEEGLVLFPISRGGTLVAAPSLAGREDLLQPPEAAGAFQLSFEGKSGGHWPVDRRESLQGLSEREAAELVARTLLAHWGIQPSGRVVVERMDAAPYAVAYVDGFVRLNPCFLYLVAAYGAASPPASAQ